MSQDVSAPSYRRLLPALLSLLLAGMVGNAHGQVSSADRVAMDRAYSAWRTAMITKDGAAWEKATAPSRKVATKNLAISQRHAFPKSLFEVPVMPPSVLQLRFLDEQVAGDWGQLFYFGKVDMGVGDEIEIPENLLILRFIRDGGTWLFDSLKFVNLEGSDEQRAQLSAGDLAPLREGGFSLPEAPPTVGKIVSYPDFVGHLQITANGYRATASVNGNHCGIVENANVTNLVIGGFDQGANKLVVEVDRLPLEDETKRFFTMQAFVLTGERDRPRARIFLHQPEDMHAIPERIETDIWANAVTIQGRGQP